MKPGRNDPCPCGSGKKYKKCCEGKTGFNPPAPKLLGKGTVPTVAECNQLVALFNAGRYAELESQTRLLLERCPDSGFAWKTWGASLQMQGKDSLPALQKATELLPNDAEAHYNLGNTLKELGRLAEAEASYRQSLQIKPDYAEAYNKLGNILLEMSRLGEAEASYRRALRIKPNFAQAHNNLGNVLRKQGNLDEAIASFRMALSLNPDYAIAYGNLGGAFKDQGKLDEALACFQQQIRLTPENGSALHQIASLTGSNAERAPIQYVESLFDDYADKFDTQLQQVLKYEIPEKVVALVMQHATPPAEKWNALDLGCGTGLVGSAISPFARQLVGVDLSAKMLEKARARNVYQRLEHLDLLVMMRGEKASSYDVIIAADVFIYLGRLDEIVSEIKRLLCPGGFFAFSIEALGALPNEETSQGAQREYQLENTGRYSHSSSYITRLASANGFLPQEMAAAQIRMEYGKPVDGHLVLWKS